MKGLCIDTINKEGFSVDITVGKWYELRDTQGVIIVSLSSYFWIRDDSGRTTVSLRSNFKTLEQVRDERLVELFG